jgi:protein ImuB
LGFAAEGESRLFANSLNRGAKKHVQRLSLSGRAMSFASIFVPDFLLQAVVRSAPGIKSIAMVLVDAASPLRPVICENQQASARGIKLGMSKSEVEQFGGIEILQRSRVQEKIAHAALLELAWSISPRVEDTAPDNIVLDLAGLASLFGSDENIARCLAEGAERLGMEAQIAAASNIEAAVLASRTFPGITVIPEGEEAAILGKAPVAALLSSAVGVSLSRQKDETARAKYDQTDLLETLERWGVRTCASFVALPVLELSERLGQEGVRLHEWARGKAVRALIPAQPSGYFEEEMELEDAVAEMEPLSVLLAELLERMCSRIAARSLAAGAINLRLQLEPSFEEDRNASGRSCAEIIDRQKGAASEGFELTLPLPVPMSDPKTLLKLLVLRLESAPPSAPIVKIMLGVDAAPPRTSQGDLFSAICPDPEKVELTVARLASLVGDANLGSPELLDTHRPEGFRMRRFVPSLASRQSCRPSRRSPGARIEKEPRAHGHAPRSSSQGLEVQAQTAFRVFRPAAPARVETRNGYPVQIAFSGFCGRVIAASGPWRSSGDWWREDFYDKDEWDLEIQSNAKRERGEQPVVYRVCYDWTQKAWFVRGAFD